VHILVTALSLVNKQEKVFPKKTNHLQQRHPLAEAKLPQDFGGMLLFQRDD
jgi:hypothetical protein